MSKHKCVVTLVSFCSWLPVLGTDNWQADLTFLVYVGMVDFGFEGDPRGLEGVFSREDDLHSKCSLVIRCAILVWGVGNVTVAQRGSCTCIYTLLDTLPGNRAFIWCWHWRTYRNNKPLPGEHVWFIHLNAAEALDRRLPNVFKLLYTQKDKMVDLCGDV